MQDDTVAQGWIATAAATLDVRPTLAEGGEPFVAIMEAAAAVPLGEWLVIIAPFEPAPLYGALGARGFTHETQRIADDAWAVRFTRAE